MADTLTLKELKAQNLAEEQEKNKPVEDGPTEADDKKPEDIKPEENLKPDDDDPDAEEIEDWQKAEEDDSDDGEKSKIDNAGWKKARLDKKALKTTVKDQADELELANAEIARLKAAPPAAKPVEELPPRPKREDFSFDDDKYDEAMDAWHEKRTEILLNKKLALRDARESETQQENTIIQKQSEAVDKHYERAAELVNTSKVKEEDWRTGDTLIRKTLDAVSNGKGDVIADQLIAQMTISGDGSEKAWYFLGRNPVALGTLQQRMVEDPTGLQAVMYLKELQLKATSSKRRTSEAPAPADDLTGDAVSGQAKTLQKQYNKLTDPGARVSLKRKAKAAGVDVSNW